MPPIDQPTPLPAAPEPIGNSGILVQPVNPDHIPQWAVKGLIAIVVLIMIPGTIAVVSYVFGGIHSRLSDNEKAIQTLKEERSAFDARLERNETVDRRQWELLSDLKDKLGTHNH